MKVFKYIIALAAAVGFSSAALAAELVSGLGGPEGYGELSQSRNDDSSSNQLELPFDVNFFGHTYSTFYVNNNGNITFNGPVSTYTPRPFPISSQPMIAPYWGDVDTRCAACGAVYVASPNETTAVVTWHNVGFYSNQSSKTNDFQLILSDRSSVAGAGDFDIEFRYNRLEWTTGQASGGDINGLGGTPAQAGYDAGDTTNFFTLPGSQTAGVLDLATTSNVSVDTPGLWRFAIRNGEITGGESASTPLLPTVVTEAGYQFNFGVVINTRVFIDPLIATGYDYVVNSGPNITSVVFPVLGDADGYDVYGFNSSTSAYDILLGNVLGGATFNFATGGVDRFGVRGIDPNLALDPNNPAQFVTGLTFAGTDNSVSLTQTPITTFIAPAVPEAQTWAMMIGGIGVAGGTIRRRRKMVAVTA